MAGDGAGKTPAPAPEPACFSARASDQGLRPWTPPGTRSLDPLLDNCHASVDLRETAAASSTQPRPSG